MSKRTLSFLYLLTAFILVGCARVNAEPAIDDESGVATYSDSLPVMDDGGLYEVLDGSGAYMTGSALKTNRLRVAYLDCDPDWRDYAEYYHPAEGYRVVRAYFRFENVSDADSGCGRFDFTCEADGVAYKEFYVGADDDLPAFTPLGVGEKVDGWLYFAVPENSVRVELTYSGDDLRSDGNESFVFVIG